MKITKIDITNAIGARRFDESVAAPIVLLAGRNGAGKSSIIQAVRLALTGEMPRVSLKKEAGALVSEGAKAGHIAIEWDGGSASVSLPDLAAQRTVDPRALVGLAEVADMHLFADLAENDRRAFLFRLTGTTASPEEVRRRLIDRGASAANAEAIVPMLRAGFPAACDEAKGKARDAKAAWRTVTGEAYGEKKAETWRAQAPAFNAADLAVRREELAAAQAESDAAIADLAALKARATAAAEQAGKIEAIREKAGRFARIADKLARDEAELKEWQDKIAAARGARLSQDAIPCPDCGSLLVMRDGALVHAAPLAVGTEDDIGSIPAWEKAAGLMEKAVANGKRDLAESEAAARILESFSAEAADLDPAPIAEAQERVNMVKAQIADWTAAIKAGEAAERAAAECDQKNAQAARWHGEAAAWALIGDALAPDGIPGELLAQALDPFNASLAQSASDTGWRQVSIDADMAIRAAGRPYAMLSESEQWRADAMLTAAIAQLSGLKLMILDRLDVLDLDGRSEALAWLEVMAEAGEIDTVIVGATLKEIPGGLPADHFAAFWIAGGEVVKIAEKAAA